MRSKHTGRRTSREDNRLREGNRNQMKGRDREGRKAEGK